MSKNEESERIKEMKKIIEGKDPESIFYPVFLNILTRLNKLEERIGEEE